MFRCRKGIVLWLALSLGLFLCGCGKGAGTSGMTMREALEVADAQARQWQEDAVLLSVASSDNGDAESERSGREGERNCWLFSYKSNLSARQYSFCVLNGEVCEPQETTIAYYGPIPEEWTQLDSADAYELAVDRGMIGGSDAAWGYHYMLQYGQDAETQAIMPIFSVMGSDQDVNEMVLHIDPRTGEEMDVQVKSGSDENGSALWETKWAAERTEEINPDWMLSREELQEEWEVWEKSEEYYMLPEEFTDNIIVGERSNHFSPYGDVTAYSKKEWKGIMSELYPDRNMSGMTMQEALEIADAQARQWQEDAVLLSVVSSDKEDTESEQNGERGERNCWLFYYKSNLNSKQYSFYILNGEVCEPMETAYGYYGPIPEEWIQLDSDDAYELALNHGMLGGTDWAWGYHYMLQYCQDAETKAIMPILSVRGRDRDGNEMILNIDPRTGEETDVQVKNGYDENGSSLWETRWAAERTEEINPDWMLSREELQEKWEVWEKSEEYYMLPEEFTDNIIVGERSNHFSPYGDVTAYSEEEWKRIMSELYPDRS